MTAVGSLRVLGLQTALSYAAARALAGRELIAYHRYLIVAVPRSGMPSPQRGLVVRPVEEAELQSLVVDVSKDVQQARFAKGLTCLGAFDAGALVGVNWLARGQFDEDEVFVRYKLPEKAAWDTGLWVRPDRRLSRAFAALWAGTAAWMEVNGLDWSMSRIADYNLASLNSHRRMGAKTIGSLTCLRIGSAQFSAGLRPYFANVRRGPAPVLQLELPE